jgi:hypothetical protein
VTTKLACQDNNTIQKPPGLKPWKDLGTKTTTSSGSHLGPQDDILASGPTYHITKPNYKGTLS